MEKQCTRCTLWYPLSGFPKKDKKRLHNLCCDCKNQRDRDTMRALRHEALERYSNGSLSCACCGEAHFEFLVIDHIHGGGNIHRAEVGHRAKGSKIYRWLKNSGYPEGFRVLCASCNHSLGLYGYCPHQKK